MSQYRYPGVNPFTTEQAALFFGREADTAQLLQLVRFEQVVVLYGKSGLGKSSLLNAGVLPALHKEGKFTSVVIRLGAWTQGKTETPAAIVKQSLVRENYIRETLLDKLLPYDNSLWYFAKTRQLNGGSDALLLVFDQFEELFTYPDSALNEFKNELAELLYTSIPQRFRRALENRAWSDGDVLAPLYTPLEIKVLIAIRADRMHLLDHLSSHLPNILRHCYRLEALLRSEAESAIVQPAKATDSEFVTPPFLYTQEALDALLDYLEDPADHRVEGILLQMLCEYFEKEKVKKQGILKIDKPDLGNLEKLVENYYHNKINSLGPIGRRAIRRLIEEGLVVEGDNTRLSLHEEQITTQFGVSKEMLENLVDSRLLRAEPFLRGGYTYELSHDRLVPPVLKAKVERLLAEEARTQKNALMESQIKQARSRRATALMAFVALTFLITALIAYWQSTDIVFAKKLIQRETSYLNLSKLDIKYLPFEFWQSVRIFTYLESLNLSGTRIAALPPDIGVYKNLRELFLANTPISLLPSEIGNLTNLQLLDVSGTQLIQLPPETSRLDSLRSLNLAYTPITQLPYEIGYLSHLRSLDLSQTGLNELPTSIGNLTCLDSLTLSGTRLIQLPIEVGNLSNLRSLDLSQTGLNELPTSIGNLTNLQSLNLSQTNLTQLPPEIGNLSNLKSLNLSHTKIKTLPAEIGRLDNLQSLDLSHTADPVFSIILPPEFFQLRNLTDLNFKETSIVVNFDTLHAQMPRCRIHW
ncbi:MAG: hypothetical protein EPGJADBJ_04404 [Saprospiraceae bacterium]|nr:hypothetical protein [Saprospiraceae bacterium]